MVSILRAFQYAVDPGGATLRWGANDAQPCPPWVSGNSNPGQNTSLPGYGRSWLGVKCAEWDFSALSTSTLLAGVAALQIKRLNLVGTLSPTVCALFPSLTMLDVSQNALRGVLPPCLGAQGATVSGRFMLSVFDNLARCCLLVLRAYVVLTRAACARQFESTIPASYTALMWMAVSYNPYLYGQLPAGLSNYKLAAWSACQNRCVALRTASEARTPALLTRPTAASAATILTIMSWGMAIHTGPWKLVLSHHASCAA